jgi:hypothetical protein
VWSLNCSDLSTCPHANSKRKRKSDLNSHVSLTIIIFRLTFNEFCESCNCMQWPWTPLATRKCGRAMKPGKLLTTTWEALVGELARGAMYSKYTSRKPLGGPWKITHRYHYSFCTRKWLSLLSFYIRPDVTVLGSIHDLNYVPVQIQTYFELEALCWMLFSAEISHSAWCVPTPWRGMG